MPTAQEQYKAMVRDGLWPRLRELGFKGSGVRFDWPSTRVHAGFTLQKSKFSNKQTVDFRANATCVSRAVWSLWTRSERGYGRAPSGVVSMRITPALIPHPASSWWTLTADADWSPVADVVVDTIRDHFIPGMARVLAASDEVLYRDHIDPARWFDEQAPFGALRYDADCAPFIDRVMDVVFRQGSPAAIDLFPPGSIPAGQVTSANRDMIEEHGPLASYTVLRVGRVLSDQENTRLSPQPFPIADFVCLGTFAHCEGAVVITVGQLDGRLWLLNWKYTPASAH